MQPKYVTVKDVSLAYIEKNPEAKDTIFFIHGNSSSAKIWAEQFISPQLSRYRLIAVDLPAHGNSSKGNDYSLPGIGRILSLALVSLIAAGDYIIAGLSLGTNILAEMLAYDIEPAGLIVMGSCMLGTGYGMEKVFKPGIDMHAAFTDTVSEEELKQYWRLAGVSAADRSKYKNFTEDYTAVKDSFRSKMFATVGEGKLSDQIGLLEKSGIPSLVIFGEEELVCDKDYLDNSAINLWNNKVYKLPQAGHLVPLDKQEELNLLIRDFARDIFK
ncbi:MAG: alpha/beta hydrolase [Bacteroidetes bacterium]|nr:alpha/beta hydrolase [Bacteroidota bacterium]